MLTCSAYGRLGKTPERKETRNEKVMAVSSLAVDVASYDAAGEVTMWISIAAFGRTAEQLLRHDKGDLLSVMGRLTLRQWQDREGRDRESWSLLAESLHSSRTVRPKGGRKRTPQQQAMDMQAPQRNPRDPNDPIPF